MTKLSTKQKEIIQKLQVGGEIKIVPAKELSPEMVQAYMGLFWKKLIKATLTHYKLTARGRELDINS